MESKKERVLAYSKAKLIGLDTLSNIAGGTHTTVHATCRPSAANQRGLDVVCDPTFDN